MTRTRIEAVAFVALAFTVSWACWGAVLALGGDSLSFPLVVPFAAASFGPALAAGVLRIAGGGTRIRVPVLVGRAAGRSRSSVALRAPSHR